MSEILVTFGEIANGQQAVATTSRNVDSQLSDLKQFVQRLVSSWTGEAAEQYQVKQAQWDQAAADLNQVLNQIGVALGTANENYQGAEKANTSRFA